MTAEPFAIGRGRPALTAVTELLDAAERADDVAPFGEPVLLALRRTGQRAEGGAAATGDRVTTGRTAYATAAVDDRLVGLAVATPSGTAVEVELAVHPDHRRRGVGRSLLAASGGAAPRLAWAHGDLPAARAFAAAAGFRAVRTLHRLRRSLTLDLPPVELPDGVLLRPFRVGADDGDWVRVNALAFAHHPEQRSMTLADLRDRQGEAWFSAPGFLVAEKAGAMAGFHWTKVHDVGTPEAVGEVYVVGVDPSAKGLHLGRALTLAGLHHLRDLGLSDVMLYVDDDNTAAMRLYERLGFTRWTADVQYSDAPP